MHYTLLLSAYVALGAHVYASSVVPTAPGLSSATTANSENGKVALAAPSATGSVPEVQADTTATSTHDKSTLPTVANSMNSAAGHNITTNVTAGNNTTDHVHASHNSTAVTPGNDAMSNSDHVHASHNSTNVTTGNDTLSNNTTGHTTPGNNNNNNTTGNSSTFDNHNINSSNITTGIYNNNSSSSSNSNNGNDQLPPPPASGRCSAQDGPERATTLAHEFGGNNAVNFEALFDAIDEDHDGYITARECRRYFDKAISTKGTPSAQNEVLVGNIAAVADKNADGKVTKLEFVTGMQRLWNTTFTACAGECDAVERKLNGCGIDTSMYGETSSEHALFQMRSCHLGSTDFKPFAQCVKAKTCADMNVCFQEASMRNCGRYSMSSFAAVVKHVNNMHNTTFTVTNEPSAVSTEQSNTSIRIGIFNAAKTLGVVAIFLVMAMSMFADHTGSLFIRMFLPFTLVFFTAAVVSMFINPSNAGNHITLRGPMGEVCPVYEDPYDNYNEL